MLIMNHVASGAIVGLASPNVPSAATLGFVSHFVLDAFPHWGSGESDWVPVAIKDGLVGLGLAATTIAISHPDDRTRVAAGILGACLPDSDKPNTLFFGAKLHPTWFVKFHQRIQTEHTYRMPQEWAVAAGLTGVFVGLTLMERRRRKLNKTSEAQTLNLPVEPLAPPIPFECETVPPAMEKSEQASSI